MFYRPYCQQLLRCYPSSSFSYSCLCIWLCFHLSDAPDTDFGAHNQQTSFPKLPILLSLIFPKKQKKIQSRHPTLSLKTQTVFRAVHIVSRYGLLFRVSPWNISHKYYSVFGKPLHVIRYVWICVTWQILHSFWTLRRNSPNFERLVFGLDLNIQFHLICSFDLFKRAAYTKESQTLSFDCHCRLSFLKNRIRKTIGFFLYIYFTLLMYIYNWISWYISVGVH